MNSFLDHFRAPKYWVVGLGELTQRVVAAR